MRTDRVRDGEGPERLSARIGVPVCMILRANRLVSAMWLVPGREIEVPEADFCEKDAFVCPVKMVCMPARETPGEVCIAQSGDTIGSMAEAMGTAERILWRARWKNGALCEGERLIVDREQCSRRIGSVLPGETAERFCERFHADLAETMRLNGLKDGRVWPGMRLILPD